MASTAREARLRREAQRRGFALHKSRRRNPTAPDFGTYSLVDMRPGHHAQVLDNATLDDVERFLDAPRGPDDEGGP